MGIKRYYATKNNTLTNAYKANLSTRGVSGNMPFVPNVPAACRDSGVFMAWCPSQQRAHQNDSKMLQNEVFLYSPLLFF